MSDKVNHWARLLEVVRAFEPGLKREPDGVCPERKALECLSWRLGDADFELRPVPAGGKRFFAAIECRWPSSCFDPVRAMQQAITIRRVAEVALYAANVFAPRGADLLFNLKGETNMFPLRRG